MKRLEYDFVKLTNYKITWDENIYHFVYVPPMALDTPRNNEPYLIYHRVEGHRMTYVEFATLMRYCDAFKPLMKKSIELNPYQNPYQTCRVEYISGMAFINFSPSWTASQFKFVHPDTIYCSKEGKLYDGKLIPLRMLYQFVSTIFREFITVAELPENVRVTSSEEEFLYLTNNLETFIDEVIHWIDSYYYESYDYDDD